MANVSPEPWVSVTSVEVEDPVDEPPLEVFALPFASLLLLLPPHPTATSATSARTAMSSLPADLFISGTPSLCSEPVWTGTRCSCAHRVRDLRRPGAPSRGSPGPVRARASARTPLRRGAG